MGLAVGDVNEAGDIAMQVQQRMHPHCSLGGAKRCPWVQRQTQIDRGGVQIDTQRLPGAQGSSHADQVLRKVGIDLPRSCSVRISQRIARNGLATKAHVVQPFGLGAQVDFDVAQGLAMGQLPKGHGHELGKHEPALVHGASLREHAKDQESGVQRSNRDQTEIPNSASKSLTYDVLV